MTNPGPGAVWTVWVFFLYLYSNLWLFINFEKKKKRDFFGLFVLCVFCQVNGGSKKRHGSQLLCWVTVTFGRRIDVLPRLQSIETRARHLFCAPENRLARAYVRRPAPHFQESWQNRIKRRRFPRQIWFESGKYPREMLRCPVLPPHPASGDLEPAPRSSPANYKVKLWFCTGNRVVTAV